ncbi:hypothetical protein FQN60_014123 [Etheostoma spectabile]|uniref:Sema domain-containing protein n=1 Tax=Etheostoma spectabile TaxID=54343 RepID=A0A5J5D9M8_9PERO|nr:hypothetical protein FQN60_014123 [Etheostoma spectabile]
MLESNNLVTFEGLANSSAYHTFLLDEEKGRLVVGAKDHIFSFNLLNISRDYTQSASQGFRSLGRLLPPEEMNASGQEKIFRSLINQRECSNFIKVLQPFNQTHLYVCGTGAFHPVCSYLEVGKKTEDSVFRLEPLIENGRGKSPYDPKLLTASMLIDGELYAGTSADFMGRDFAIFRTLGKHHPIRTEQHDSRWLNDPRFVGVHLIPESDNPEDDKIYLLFKENALDGEHAGKATHARIGQLCKNDLGGHRSLVNKWTTFLKARLICSVPGSNGIDTHFDELHMGTILKVVSIPRGSWHDLEEVLLEEMTVFREPTAITAMELSTKQQQLYLGSDIGVSQMPLHRCEVYGKACAECCLARDPY